MANSATPLPEKLTADEFCDWVEQQTDGKFELHAGVVVAMAPERTEHGRVKFAVAVAHRSAIADANAPCEALVDSLGVRINDDTLYIPDALVQCGDRLALGITETPDPTIVVEVLSPSTQSVDFRVKLEDYFKLASVHHYLVIDPLARRVIHHRRQTDDAFLTRILATGPLTLDPPGITIAIDDVFASLPPESEEAAETGAT